MENINITTEQFETIETLKPCLSGGFAAIKGYVLNDPKRYEEEEIVNMTFVSKFSYVNYITKKLAILKGIEFTDVKCDHEKITSLPIEKQMAIFEERKSFLIKSIEKTLSGDRSDAHRKGHDEFYRPICPGLKVHLKTTKLDGKTVLVLENGKPSVDSIMISGLPISRTIVKKGKRVVVNSQAKTHMKNAIEKVMNIKPFMTFTFKKDNFETLTIDKREVKQDDLF